MDSFRPNTEKLEAFNIKAWNNAEVGVKISKKWQVVDVYDVPTCIKNHSIQ